MIRIEDFQKDTLRDLERGKKFMGNDPHYSKGPFVFMSHNSNGTIVVWDKNSLEKRVMDLRAVLRGFDCQEYVWC